MSNSILFRALRRCVDVLVLSGALTMAKAGEAAPVGASRSWFILNEDDSHFFGSRALEDMTRAGLEAWVDQYAGTAVTHLFLCPNAMKASHRSRVRDAIWEMSAGQKAPQEEFARKWVENARRLDERGLDPYAIWIARCREKKISPWLSMRMNDVHNVDDVDSYIHSSFWRTNRSYWRVPGGGGWTDRALDYGRPEVRAHAMDYVRELLEKYDADGLELDWMRFGYHFQPGQEGAGAALLTDFMREVRGLTQSWAKKRGHPIRLGARVPTTPESARGLGMDGVAWAQAGLVDLLVPTPFWATTDFDIPLERWRERMGETARSVVLAPGAEILVRAYPAAAPVEQDLTSVRGFAASMWGRGANAIYLFNFMDPAPMVGGRPAYRQLLEEGLGVSVVSRSPRRHVLTYRDTVAAGVSAEVRLPFESAAGSTFRLHLGRQPANSRAEVVLGLADGPGVAVAAFAVAVNQANCPFGTEATDRSTMAGVARAVSHEIPAGTLVDGYQEVQVKALTNTPSAKVVWAELRITPR